jgi:predicted nucleotidyltransferase
VERTQAIAKLKAHETELKRLGVQHLCPFCSTARNEARGESDVDLFFDYETGALRLFGLMEVQQQATRILGHTADIMTRDGIHQLLRDRIGASALQVF